MSPEQIYEGKTVQKKIQMKSSQTKKHHINEKL